MNKFFQYAAQKTATFAGSPLCFLISLVLVIIWWIWSYDRGFDNLSQIIGNSIISTVTLQLVLLVQNTQNRDMKALHIKLDEIICSIDKARNKVISAENLPDEDLNKLSDEFKAMDKMDNVNNKVADVEQRVDSVEEDVNELKKEN